VYVVSVNVGRFMEAWIVYIVLSFSREKGYGNAWSTGRQP